MQGDIRQAFQSIMKYLLALNVDFKGNYPQYRVSANFYYGDILFSEP